jgi:hypothetical protein
LELYLRLRDVQPHVIGQEEGHEQAASSAQSRAAGEAQPRDIPQQRAA